MKANSLKEIVTASEWEKAAGPSEKREALIEGLNHDLAREYQTVLMYLHFAARLTGLNRRNLRTLFQAEAADEQSYAQLLFQTIDTMYGKPTTKLRPVPYLTQPDEMIACALRTITQAIADDTARIGQAKECGDFRLTMKLEAQLADRIRHKEAFVHQVAIWSNIDLERTENDALWQDIGGEG